MSNRNDRDFNRNNETPTEDEREKLTLDVEKAVFADSSIGRVNIMTSVQLCGILNNILRGIFDDYEGCKYVVPMEATGQYDAMGRPIKKIIGVPEFQIFFHHRLAQDSDYVVAFSPDAESKDYKNKTYARTQNFNRRFREGNAYKITNDGKDIIENFVFDNEMCRSKKGKVIWEKITVDVAQPNANPQYREVLSMVGGIDPAKVLAARYKADDAEVEYSVILQHSMPAAFVGNGNDNFQLLVTEIDKVQIDRAARDLGYQNPNGLGIIK